MKERKTGRKGGEEGLGLWIREEALQKGLRRGKIEGWLPDTGDGAHRSWSVWTPYIKRNFIKKSEPNRNASLRYRVPDCLFDAIMGGARP